VGGLEINLLIDVDGISFSGGGLKVDGKSSSGMRHANVTDQGSDPFTVSLTASSTDRENIERFVKEFAALAPGSEINWLTEDRTGYIERASASPVKPSAIIVNGIQTWLYESEASVVCRDARSYGDPIGSLGLDASLPYSLPVTNVGLYDSGLDYLMMSGGYDGRYTTDLRMEMTGERIDLCRKLLRGDSWKMGRWGDVLHSYETKFEKTEAEFAIDLHGFVDLGPGGATTYQACTIGANGSIMIPFHGPIASSRAPYLEPHVTGMAGSPEIIYALSGDPADIIATSHVLRTGKNRIRLPEECIGEDLILAGIRCDANSWITLSCLYAEVQRHVSENVLPVLEVGESDTITISGANMCNGYLEQLHVRYRDVY
jgi:hypothetical protein